MNVIACTRTTNQQGFTLLEVLVAVLIFALASALAYGGLQSIVRAQAQTRDATARLGQLQFAIGLFERDVMSLSERAVRDNYGALQPAFEGTSQGFSLTRYGYANVLALPRAELERVEWQWRDKTLLRRRWPVLDRAPGTRPQEDALLDKVPRMEVVYLDARQREHRQWPPPQQQEAVLPRAVRLTLSVEGFGEITRLLDLSQRPES